MRRKWQCRRKRQGFFQIGLHLKIEPGFLLLMGAISLLAVSSAKGQEDRVSLRDDQTGEVTQFNADVVDWDARRLVILVNGRHREIASRRVVDVVPARSESLIEADAFFASGKLPQAMQAYERALTPQLRPWVIRGIRARLLQCASGLGQPDRAISEFLRIADSNPETRYFHLIPLVWDRSSPPHMPTGIQNWLKGAGEIRALIAASWVLQQHTDEAEAALSALKQSEDSRIAHLATAQPWRLEIITASRDDLTRWQAAIDRMPPQLQAGPRYVAAVTRKRLATTGRTVEDKANGVLISLMRIPILYPEHYQLAAAALLESRNLMRDMGRLRESNIVHQELQRDYGYSHAAALSRQEIPELSDQQR